MHQGIGGLIAMARGNYGFVIGHLDIRPLSALTLATVGPQNSKMQQPGPTQLNNAARWGSACRLAF